MSANIKLPNSIKDWKIISRLSDENGNAVFKVSKKDYDGTVIPALLRYVVMSKEDYVIDNTDFINDEAAFLKKIAQSGDCFNYLDICVNNNPAKKKIEFFIITEDLQPLSELLKSKSFSEAEIVDFGIQMCSILERLEANNIFHGNLNPDNIFVTFDGKYKLGGFSDFESKISDMSFIAPEIYKKENADFTTDIYSLGLIMYLMSNNGALPFESENVSRDDAIKARFDGKSITAPKNGSEKLKSVIVIACQPNNGNRWKNAGNIKNALTSIRGEISGSDKNENIIVPETTDFDGNVFEEFEYNGADAVAEPESQTVEVTAENTDTDKVVVDEDVNDNEEMSDFVEIEAVTEISEGSDSEENPSSDNGQADDKNSENAFEEAVAVGAVVSTASDAVKTEAPAVENADSIEIDNRVFENYEPKKTDDSFKQKAQYKDYGDFFEDDEPVKTAPVVTEDKSDIDNNDKIINIFDSDDSDDEVTEKKPHSKKNAVIIAVCIIAILGALGFVAFCLMGGLGNGENENTTEAPTTAEVTTVMPTTTAPPTTVAPTTVPPKNVVPVVGYGYSYAKELLEAEGFTVEIGEYAHSDYWPEGYVIAQSPAGDTEAKNGSVVTLDISLGSAEPETTAAPTEPPTEPPTEAKKPVSGNTGSSSSTTKKNNNYILADSSSKKYTEAELNKLSDDNLETALNEIYARYGRGFVSKKYYDYFNSQSWYTQKYTAAEFDRLNGYDELKLFNEYEVYNHNLIKSILAERGLR